MTGPVVEKGGPGIGVMDYLKKPRKKVCYFCKDKVTIDYKDTSALRRFMSERGKIKARRVTGNCTQHQRKLAIAIKRAREVALLPYATASSGRVGGGRRDRGH